MVAIALSVYGRKGLPPIHARRQVIAECTTVYDLLVLLESAGELPQKFGAGEGFSEFLVYVNGENAMINRLDTLLRDGDRVVVMPALAGG